MVKRLLFSVFVFFSLLALSAQTVQKVGYIQRLRNINTKGRLTIVQSPTIDSLVNYRKCGVTVHASAVDSSSNTHLKSQPQKMMGYRIQVYAGPKSTGQQQARNYERRCKEKLPGVSTYVRFVQPRWTCRIGDFQTREEAQLFLEKVNEANISTQTTIVRCEIFKIH